MIDQTHIDLLQLIPTEMKRVASTGGGEYHGPCPFCGGKDRFVAQPKNGRWFCRRCESNGDAIALVMKLHNKSFTEALDALKLEQERQPVRRSTTPAPVGPRPGTGNKTALCLTSDHWQERAHKFATYAWESLHSPEGNRAMDYLKKRGLTLPVICAAGIGYNPTYITDVWGGRRVHLPPGIVFVWRERPNGRIMRLNIRLANPVNGQRYIQAAGGTNWLWNAQFIQPESVVVMVEGEMDALSVYAAVGYGRVCPVATGSTTGSRLMRWVARLSMASHVLIAFDDDDAGRQASSFWLKVLPRAKRALPTQHDLNEMLRYGDDIRGWINQHIGETS